MILRGVEKASRGMRQRVKSKGQGVSERSTLVVACMQVGDPLKDTSGPSLNILIKLMAVESLVFAPFFSNIAGGKGFFFEYFNL